MSATSISFSASERDLRRAASARFAALLRPTHAAVSPETWQGRPPLPACAHARARMDARRIGVAEVELAIDFGRALRRRGALIYFVGDKEVVAAARLGVDLRALAGVHVICSHYDGMVKTVYRNRVLQLQSGYHGRLSRAPSPRCA